MAVAMRVLLTVSLVLSLTLAAEAKRPAAIVADHTSTDLDQIPEKWISRAKKDLHIAYGHTSHGSQLVTGMKGLVGFKGERYAFRGDGGRDVLDLRDRPFSGANDLGNPNRTAWADATRTYLRAHKDTNVVLWSWCGQAATSIENIDTYLDSMEGLIDEFPKVTFVFMTGHLNGSGAKGKLHLANEHIRAHCREKGVDWYRCGSAHSQPLDANRKAYAAWWLWARLADWDGA